MKSKLSTLSPNTIIHRKPNTVALRVHMHVFNETRVILDSTGEGFWLRGDDEVWVEKQSEQ